MRKFNHKGKRRTSRRTQSCTKIRIRKNCVKKIRI